MCRQTYIYIYYVDKHRQWMWKELWFLYFWEKTLHLDQPRPEPFESSAHQKLQHRGRTASFKDLPMPCDAIAVELQVGHVQNTGDRNVSHEKDNVHMWGLRGYMIDYIIAILPAWRVFNELLYLELILWVFLWVELNHYLNYRVIAGQIRSCCPKTTERSLNELGKGRVSLSKDA